MSKIEKDDFIKDEVPDVDQTLLKLAITTVDSGNFRRQISREVVSEELKDQYEESVKQLGLCRDSTYGGNLNELSDAAKEADAILGKPPVASGTFTPEMKLVGVVGLAISLWTGIGLYPAHWVVILVCLWTIAACTVGVANMQKIYCDFKARQLAVSWLTIPLTDKKFDLAVANTFANSCQVREKGLKIMQYIFRLGAYCAVFSEGTSKALKDLSKTTSIARRFFKFCRWVKHFNDVSEARDEKSHVMRSLLYIRLVANVGADWAEDVCSLQRIGILPKSTLSVEFMLFAEYCQLVLAIVEICVTTVRVRKTQSVTEAAERVLVNKEEKKSLITQQRKLAMVRLELVKFISDVGKAIHDCEFSFAHEGIFICCALFSALISTHKNMWKVIN